MHQIYKGIGFPRWLSGKDSACQSRRHRFNPWVGKIPWRRKWQPTPILAWRFPWTEEPGRLPSMGSQRVERDRALTHTYKGIFKVSMHQMSAELIISPFLSSSLPDLPERFRLGPQWQIGKHQEI